MKGRVFLFFFCIACLSGSAQLYRDSVNKYSSKLLRYLDKDKKLNGFYEINDKGISIFSSPKDKGIHKTEFFLAWNELSAFKNLSRILNAEDLEALMLEKGRGPFQKDTSIKNSVFIRKQISKGTFKGIKIAIDPGHIAGDYQTARLESKYINFRVDSSIGVNEKIQFFEGELTLATAKILQKKLVAAGAEVMLTRNEENTSAFGCTFEDWFDNDFTNLIEKYYSEKKLTINDKIRLLDKSSSKTVFQKYFFDAELKERARKINAFMPDATVIIHYNVDEKNTDWKKPSNKNFTMAFVPGSLVQSDLNSRHTRLEFLRLIVTDDLEKSLLISENLVKSFEKNLSIPAAKPENATYLKDKCLSTEKKGVYCRNLILNRLVHSPLVYGECLYQDNFNECRLLNKKDIEIDGIKTSSRVAEVAEAYFEALKTYFQIPSK